MQDPRRKVTNQSSRVHNNQTSRRVHMSRTGTLRRTPTHQEARAAQFTRYPKEFRPVWKRADHPDRRERRNSEHQAQGPYEYYSEHYHEPLQGTKSKL